MCTYLFDNNLFLLRTYLRVNFTISNPLGISVKYRLMKILYAIQANGIGPISLANEILPYLDKKCQVDVLVSGTHCEVDLEHFVKFRRNGTGFERYKNGGVNFLATFQMLRSKKFLKEVKAFPVEEYDGVINDYEPVSAWACRMKNVPCVALSHQFALFDREAPRPEGFDPMARMVLRDYAPCKTGIGFHFKNCTDHIFTPVIRREIREAYVRNLGHYTVYLPGVSDEKLIRVFAAFPSRQWHIFSRHCQASYGKNNCWVRPVNRYDFTGSLINCEGVVTASGFETPAEALFLGKKLLVVRQKHQYDQYCNAGALKELGVPVLKKLKKKNFTAIEDWIGNGPVIQINYPDVSEAISEKVLDLLASGQQFIPGIGKPLAGKLLYSTLN
jgi:uncharacterized protein (TIGR00661 family)